MCEVTQDDFIRCLVVIKLNNKDLLNFIFLPIIFDHHKTKEDGSSLGARAHDLELISFPSVVTKLMVSEGIHVAGNVWRVVECMVSRGMYGESGYTVERIQASFHVQ